MTRYEWPRLTMFLGLAALALFSVHIVRFAEGLVARQTAPPVSSRLMLEWHDSPRPLQPFHFHVMPDAGNTHVFRFKRPSGEVQIHRFQRQAVTPPPPPPSPAL